MILPAKFQEAQTFNLTSSTLTEITEYGFNVEAAKRGNPHKWLIEFRIPPKLTHAEKRELNAFLNALEGRFKTFQIPSPLPWLSICTDPQIQTNASAGENEISIDTGLLSTENAISAGDLWYFSNHDKVYQVQFNADSDSSGIATVSLTPNLFADITTSDTIAKAVFTCRLTRDTNTLDLTALEQKQSLLITAEENV